MLKRGAQPRSKVRRGRGRCPGERGPYAPGVQRRRELLEAVLRIVVRDGVSAVTHRAVAAEAGASLRSTTYYFATKHDMIREAFRFFSARSLERIDATARAARGREGNAEAAVDVIVDDMLRESRDPTTSWTAEFELILTIAREPAFAPEYRQFQARLDAELQSVMRTLGSPDPTRDAGIVLGFIRGFELEQLSRPDRKSWRRSFKRDLIRLVNALVREPG